MKITIDRSLVEQALEALEADNSKLWPSDRRTAAYFNLRAALAEPVEPVEPVAWTDADADAARLAMELEALLLSCNDTAAVSRWWDSAHDALELHWQRLSMDGLANQQKTSGSPCPTCEALARAVMMDQTGKA